MTQPQEQLIAESKRAIRERAKANRHGQADKDRLSEIICRRLAELPEYAAAQTVLFYVDARDEVRTRPLVARALGGSKQIVVPYCSARRLMLFRLENLDELAAGSYGFSNRASSCANAGASAGIGQIDLAVIPGVAFDARGGRLGHGLGYYDKLLAEARPETLRVVLAYECQMFPSLPTARHDVPVDAVITEAAVYRTSRGLTAQ